MQIEPFVNSNRPKYKSKWVEHIHRPRFTTWTRPPSLMTVKSESRLSDLDSYLKIIGSYNPPFQYFYFHAWLDSISIRWCPHCYCQVDWFDVLHAMAQQDPNRKHKVRSLAISTLHILSWIFPMCVRDSLQLEELSFG